MGSCASATVAFGVDLGNPEYGEWNFETEDLDLPAPFDTDDPDWEDLIAEFAGWDEVELPYGEQRGVPERDAWSAQRARRREALGWAGIEQGHYGYEYSGLYLSVGDEHRVDIDCTPLGWLEPPYDSDIERIEDFLSFLDAKGLVLKPEHRQPRWLLMASYG